MNPESNVKISREAKNLAKRLKEDYNFICSECGNTEKFEARMTADVVVDGNGMWIVEIENGKLIIEDEFEPIVEHPPKRCAECGSYRIEKKT